MRLGERGRRQSPCVVQVLRPSVLQEELPAPKQKHEERMFTEALEDQTEVLSESESTVELAYRLHGPVVGFTLNKAERIEQLRRLRGCGGAFGPPPKLERVVPHSYRLHHARRIRSVHQQRERRWKREEESRAATIETKAQREESLMQAKVRDMICYKSDVADVLHYLDKHDARALQSARERHLTFERNVSDEIATRVRTQMRACFKQLRQQRARAYASFLAASKNQRALFLDTFDRQKEKSIDYDPFDTPDVRYDASDLTWRDPCKRDLLKEFCDRNNVDWEVMQQVGSSGLVQCHTDGLERDRLLARKVTHHALKSKTREMLPIFEYARANKPRPVRRRRRSQAPSLKEKRVRGKRHVGRPGVEELLRDIECTVPPVAPVPANAAYE
ncbi:MAG: hypothetical protein MHM6MM_004496 [Cercozoa sp. M6MM]